MIRLDDGRPMPRPVGIETPCFHCPKTPPDSRRTRSDAVEPTAKSRTAVSHWRRCRAVGVFPDDELVIQNAVVIGDVFDAVEDARRTEAAVLVASMIRSPRA